mmetsp:Transcript_72078/g.114870  ORF Transcript_72078/g.114870 Transcript_72078/m.114870 type:complete len:580 (-) Transcript_72078:156-1895(-)
MASSFSPDIKTAEEEEEEKEKTESLSFIQQVETALNTAKSSNKLLVVLCEKCDTLNHEIWNDPKVVEVMQQNAVCLLIREQTLAFHQFTTLYPVISFPTVYVINPSNGQVLQCLFQPQQLNTDAVVQCISESALQMKQQQQVATTSMHDHNQQRSGIQINEMQSEENIDDVDGSLLSIQELESRSESLTSGNSAESTPVQHVQTKKAKQKSTLSKLQQIREKAKAQKLQNANSKTTTTTTSVSQSQPQTTSTSPSKSVHTNTNTNVITSGSGIDALEYMEITRRNKLRQRKKKVEQKYGGGARSNSSAAAAQRPRVEALSSTPILSAVNGKESDNELQHKRARLAFRINNEMEVQHYFAWDETLYNVMMFVINETGISEFTFISQYPPLNIDSIYLDRKTADSANRGLLAGRASGDDEKGNESQYDEMQHTLCKTLYELNLVPSCRVFIQPKFKGHAREAAVQSGVLAKIVNAVLDLMKLGFDGGYALLLWMLSLIWSIVRIPLSALGLASTAHDDSTRHTQSADTRHKKKTNAKSTAYARDTRFGGRNSNVMRLSHFEEQDDKNRLSNGNSTMYGGDK